MAIKIGGTTVIDNSRNVVAVSGTFSSTLVAVSGTFSSTVSSAATPTAPAHLATKQYVDDTAASSVGISVTSITVTTQSSIDFTGISSNVVEMVLTVYNLSNNNGSTTQYVRIGDSGGLETTGYSARCSNVNLGASPTLTQDYVTDRFPLYTKPSGNALGTAGSFILTRIGTAATTWTFSGNCASNNVASTGDFATSTTSGSKTLTGTLDRLSILPSGALFSGTAVLTMYSS